MYIKLIIPRRNWKNRKEENIYCVESTRKKVDMIGK